MPTNKKLSKGEHSLERQIGVTHKEIKATNLLTVEKNSQFSIAMCINLTLNFFLFEEYKVKKIKNLPCLGLCS